MSQGIFFNVKNLLWLKKHYRRDDNYGWNKSNRHWMHRQCKMISWSYWNIRRQWKNMRSFFFNVVPLVRKKRTVIAKICPYVTWAIRDLVTFRALPVQTGWYLHHIYKWSGRSFPITALSFLWEPGWLEATMDGWSEDHLETFTIHPYMFKTWAHRQQCPQRADETVMT